MGFIDNTTESHQKQLNEIREASKATETKRAIDKHWRKYQKWGSLNELETFPSSSETLENTCFF